MASTRESLAIGYRTNSAQIRRLPPMTAAQRLAQRKTLERQLEVHAKTIEVYTTPLAKNETTAAQTFSATDEKKLADLKRLHEMLKTSSARK